MWTERSLPIAPGGFFFAKPMRENNYVTMMDPFQQRYGNVLSSALIFPALVADVLWVARTLVSLGELLLPLCSSQPSFIFYLYCIRQSFSILPLMLAALFLLGSRWNYECDLGPSLCLLHHHLLAGGHNLHTAGGALLCGLHRRHPAYPDLCQPSA